MELAKKHYQKENVNLGYIVFEWITVPNFFYYLTFFMIMKKKMIDYNKDSINMIF